MDVNWIISQRTGNVVIVVDKVGEFGFEDTGLTLEEWLTKIKSEGSVRVSAGNEAASQRWGRERESTIDWEEDDHIGGDQDYRFRRDHKS